MTGHHWMHGVSRPSTVIGCPQSHLAKNLAASTAGFDTLVDTIRKYQKCYATLFWAGIEKSEKNWWLLRIAALIARNGEKLSYKGWHIWESSARAFDDLLFGEIYCVTWGWILFPARNIQLLKKMQNPQFESLELWPWFQLDNLSIPFPPFPSGPGKAMWTVALACACQAPRTSACTSYHASTGPWWYDHSGQDLVIG